MNTQTTWIHAYVGKTGKEVHLVSANSGSYASCACGLVNTKYINRPLRFRPTTEELTCQRCIQAGKR